MEYREKFGEYLFKLRMDSSLSLSELGKRVGISANYLGEIERGKKEPSDEIVRKIAEVYNIKEEDLFIMMNRVPLRIKEEAETSMELKRLLSEIAKHKGLSTETKEQLYKKVRTYYENLIEDY